MSQDVGGAEPKGWAGRVAFAPGPEPFAYRPGEVIVGGEQDADVALARFPELGETEAIFGDVDSGMPGQAFRLRGDVDPVDVVHELRLEGVVAQPNHVLLAHACGCGCCGPHPAERWRHGPAMGANPWSANPWSANPWSANPWSANPWSANPWSANPWSANPWSANPWSANPWSANPAAAALQATGVRRSSARPAAGPTLPPREPLAGRAPRIAILDTGLADEAFRPAALGKVAAPPSEWETPDEDRDTWLDPAAGHGTYIAGLIEQLAPGCDIVVGRVLTGYGDGDEVAVASAILALAGQVDVFNLSFGGYAMEHMQLLDTVMRRVRRAGAVVVASAGNEGTCRPTYPAAIPGVVGVGALGPDGPAPFTNYGSWVRACAPGVDLVSTFFSPFKGPQPKAAGTDPDDFDGWASWSGTSFAGPVVVAALAREMACYGVTAADAVKRVVDAPGLLRIPDLGTVVNLQ